MNKKILLCGSSTGGHIFPILGLGKYLNDEYEVYYLGIKGQMEEKYFLHNAFFINCNKNYKKNIASIKFYKEIKRLKKELSNFDLYIASGGISTFLISFFTKNKPLILLEQNARLSDSNRLFRHKAKVIINSFDIKTFKSVYNINPSILRLNRKEKYQNKIIFMFGSLGSSSLNLIIKKYFSSIYFSFENEYVFVCKEEYKPPFKNIKVVKYINIEEYLSQSNLFFVRSGGTTLFELLYYKIPFVNIPSKYVKHNHQEKNAKWLNSKYNIKYIKEDDFKPYQIYLNIKNRNKLNINYDLKIPNVDLKDIINEYL